MADELPPEWRVVGDDAPPDEPESVRRDFDEHLHVEQPAQTSRKMRLEWFNAASALALSEPNNPLIADMFDEGAMSVSYGESNAGKTFVQLDMAMAVATGHPWNGKAVKRGLVVYIAAEGGKRIQRRLAALKRRYHAEHGEDAPEPLLALVRFPIHLRSNDADLKALRALIRSAEAETGEKCAWVNRRHAVPRIGGTKTHPSTWAASLSPPIASGRKPARISPMSTIPGRTGRAARAGIRSCAPRPTQKSR